MIIPSGWDIIKLHNQRWLSAAYATNTYFNQVNSQNRYTKMELEGFNPPLLKLPWTRKSAIVPRSTSENELKKCSVS